MVVGGFRSYEIIDTLLEKREADYVAMSRPLIWEPDLPKRWQNGDRSPAKCVSCNSCFKLGIEKDGIYCVTEQKQIEKRKKKIEKKKKDKKKDKKK
jgi:2,4-dienoyl-CoA reductase-like NADH-dependent reductase (Old Yellow Enzyme family)